MRKWEYRKIALNEPPRGRDEIDLLCDAGEKGWDLVGVLPTGIAYLKRELPENEPVEWEEPAQDQQPIAAAPREVSMVTAQETKVKYRDPVTGDTWSGRGRMATWLKRKVDAGEDAERYRV